jgi:hypothetical protein
MTDRSQPSRKSKITTEPNCEAVLKAAKLEAFFEVRVDGNVIRAQHLAGKPAPETFLVAAQRLGVAPTRAVVVVDATVLTLFPLAIHGGPLWQPLCYAQIGGLSVATFIELPLVPVLYALFVLDLKLVKWETKVEQSDVGSTKAEE